MSLRIVIIARHHGEPGSGGARRPALLAKALRAQGHHVHVVSAYPGDHQDDILIPHPALASRSGDSANAAASPSLLEVVKAPLRSFLLWPEPDIRWARRVVAELPGYAPEADILLTTSPPESVHLVGTRLARPMRAAWWADFRDTWTLRPHRQNVRGLRAVLERRLARRWLASADAVSVVDNVVKEDVERMIPRDIPLHVVGHFSEPFEGVPTSLPQDAFNLVHTGGFSLSDHRRPLAPILTELAATRDDLMLHVAGRLGEDEIRMLDAAPFRTRHHGTLSLAQSRALQAGADALLLYTPDTSDALPGKAAEYVATGKPIVLHGDMSLAEQLPVPVYGIVDLAGITRGTPSAGELSKALPEWVEAIEDLAAKTA